MDNNNNYCINCGILIDTGDKNFIKDVELCTNCYIESDLISNSIATFYCPICNKLQNKFHKHCKHCNAAINIIDRNSYIVVIDYGIVCQNCIETSNSFYYCHSCYNYFYIDDYPLIECNDKTYCINCSEYLYSRIVHRHRYAPNWKFYKIENEKDPLFIGIELEYEFDDSLNKISASIELDNIDKIILKEDGSIPHGFEIVSHPFTLNYHRKKFNWENVLNIIANWDGYVHNNCGLHLHVNKNLFNTIEQIKLGLFVYRHSNMLQKIGDRKLNKYCKIANREKKNINCSDDRYEIVNFTNDNTIEFRFPKSTIYFEQLMANIELIHAICMYCKENGIGFIANSEWDNFVNFIENSNYNYLKKQIRR